MTGRIPGFGSVASTAGDYLTSTPEINASIGEELSLAGIRALAKAKAAERLAEAGVAAAGMDANASIFGGLASAVGSLGAAGIKAYGANLASQQAGARTAAAGSQYGGSASGVNWYPSAYSYTG